MLETAREILQNGEKSLSALSDSPAAEEVQQLLENQEPMASGFFKKVYETQQKVVKLPEYPGAMEGAEKQVKNAEGLGIAPETSVKFYDLTSQGYGSETPVVVQEKYDATITDLPDSEIEMFLNGAVDAIDSALQNDVVLQDAKITNFGLFGEEINYIDIADKESLVRFNPLEERTEEEKRAFIGNTSSMYDALARTVSQHTEYSRDQAIHHITQVSPLLDEDVEIQLPEYSLKTGLEQRLPEELTGCPDNTYKVL